MIYFAIVLKILLWGNNDTGKTSFFVLFLKLLTETFIFESMTQSRRSVLGFLECTLQIIENYFHFTEHKIMFNISQNPFTVAHSSQNSTRKLLRTT